MRSGSSGAPPERRASRETLPGGGEEDRGWWVEADLSEELRELYRFYVPEEQRERLARMGRLRRWMVAGWYLLRSLLRRLSPGRRLALVVALGAALLGRVRFDYGGRLGVAIEFSFWGFLVLLVVLMLELKDKLLARDEIAVARQVQLALLPKGAPVLAGWQVWSATHPANDVGGDLVDYVELPGGIGLVLGDVAGKGLGAALLAAKLQATVRAVAPDTPSLAELGRRLNGILRRDGIENRYATLFFAEIAADSGRVRYLNAGHNPAMVARERGVERLGASGQPLGMLDEADYDEGAVSLGVGDLLVVYSDGLTEATNEEGTEFGEARLEEAVASLRALRLQEAGRRLLGAVKTFVGTRRLGDDLSLVIASRGSQAEQAALEGRVRR